MRWPFISLMCWRGVNCCCAFSALPLSSPTEGSPHNDNTNNRHQQVAQPDKHTLALRLRTPLGQSWLHLSWHPVAARVCMGGPPVRGAASEAYSFAEQAGVALKGLVLVEAAMPRVSGLRLELQFKLGVRFDG